MKKIILTIFALNIFLVKSQTCFEDLKYKVKEAY